MGRTKYNVNQDKENRTHNGIVFDSVMEMKYFRDVVCPKVESGEIVYYELQKLYELQPGFTRNGKRVNPITYVADFFIRYSDGHEVVIDTKGCPDTTANIKKKMFLWVYPDVDYQWICYSKMDGGWLPYDYVKKCRSERRRAKKAKVKEM